MDRKKKESRDERKTKKEHIVIHRDSLYFSGRIIVRTMIFDRSLRSKELAILWIALSLVWKRCAYYYRCFWMIHKVWYQSSYDQHRNCETNHHIISTRHKYSHSHYNSLGKSLPVSLIVATTLLSKANLAATENNGCPVPLMEYTSASKMPDTIIHCWICDAIVYMY